MVFCLVFSGRGVRIEYYYVLVDLYKCVMKWWEMLNLVILLILKQNFIVFVENMIDGEEFMCFIERVCEKFILVMGYRMKFLKLLIKEKSLNGFKYMCYVYCNFF